MEAIPWADSPDMISTWPALAWPVRQRLAGARLARKPSLFPHLSEPVIHRHLARRRSFYGVKRTEAGTDNG